MTSKTPPKLPPRPQAQSAGRLPPELPRRPAGGQFASPVTPYEQDWPSNADNATIEEALPHASPTAPLPSQLCPSLKHTLPESSSSSIMQKAGTSDTSSKDVEAADLPAIVHTAASSPEVESFDRFPLSRSPSRSSMKSVTSQSGESAGFADRSNIADERPSVKLYGKRSVERQYQDALEELKSLEVVSISQLWQNRAS